MRPLRSPYRLIARIELGLPPSALEGLSPARQTSAQLGWVAFLIAVRDCLCA